jgi:uncharacterized OsmC-like protein
MYEEIQQAIFERRSLEQMRTHEARFWKKKSDKFNTNSYFCHSLCQCANDTVQYKAAEERIKRLTENLIEIDQERSSRRSPCCRPVDISEELTRFSRTHLDHFLHLLQSQMRLAKS